MPKALEGDKDELQEVTLSPSGRKETSCEVSLKKIKQAKRSAEAHFLDSDVVGFRADQMENYMQKQKRIP